MMKCLDVAEAIIKLFSIESWVDATEKLDINNIVGFKFQLTIFISDTL